MWSFDLLAIVAWSIGLAIGALCVFIIALSMFGVYKLFTWL